MTKFNITVVSDTVCPWCFIGKRRMEAAIREYKAKHATDTSDSFSVEWKPFYLQPDAPKKGWDKAEMYRSKFGGMERAQGIFARLTDAGKGDGIKFKFGGRTGNTRDSHRIIALARSKGEGTQDRVVEKLFESYFENEGDITSHEVLRAAAVAGGLDAGEVSETLGSDKFGDVVDREVIEAKRSAVSGVPHFVINDTYEFSGAQEPAAFVQLMERLKQQQPGSAPAGVNSC